MFSRELRAFVTGEGRTPALMRLRSVELGKNKILLASIMRTAARVVPGDYRRALGAPYQLLAEVEARAPRVVRDLLASPQFGAWADACTRRLLIPAGQPSGDVPLPAELGHLAAFAATAAIRSGVAFELDVPLRDGRVTFPGLGTAYPGASIPWEWGRVRQDGEGCRVRSPVSTVRVPRATAGSGAAEAWSGLPRVVIDSHGLRLRAVLDSGDPYLERYGIARTPLAEDDLRTWRRVLGEAWAILGRDHHSLARMIAGTVRTLVPVAPPAPTRSSSSTDISSFGAVALSLPHDALGMAEVLVHETHHSVLGALMDVMPLVRDGADFLGYAPWREDPRPGGALLQGIFAHYGMAQFWAQRRGIGPPAQDLRVSAEFGRLRMATARAAGALAGSGALTGPGRDFLAGIRAQLARWNDEPLPASVAGQVADVGTDHEVRWRLRHLVPDSAAVEALAGAWLRGGPPPFSPAAVAVRLEPAPPPPASANARSYLLSLRYKDPERLRSWLAGADPADAALARGRYDAAAAGYLERIAAGGDRDAWAGLAIARRHTGPPCAARVLAGRPEVAAAVHDRLRGRAPADPDKLVTWLADPP